VTIPRQASVWDERRNSSRVFPVPPDALPNALRALAAFRRAAPEHAAWIDEGFPTLTEREHLERFGEQYQKPKRSKARGTQATT
jgi:hypothetical protein